MNTTLETRPLRTRKIVRGPLKVGDSEERVRFSVFNPEVNFGCLKPFLYHVFSYLVVTLKYIFSPNESFHPNHPSYYFGFVRSQYHIVNMILTVVICGWLIKVVLFIIYNENMKFSIMVPGKSIDKMDKLWLFSG